MIKKSGTFRILFTFILLGTFLWSQKVTKIKFVGLAHLSSSAAKEIADIRVGDEMDATKINTSLKNFFSQGYFKDVWVDQQGGVLIYHFEEKVAIANIEIKGFGSGDEGNKLLQGMGLKKGDLYDSRRVKKAKRAIIGQLESQGFYDTVVEVTSSAVGKSSISLVFDVNKGEKIIIKKQNFIGAKALDQSDIELELSNKEADVLGWMPWRNDGEATVEQLEYDSYRVKNAYMEQGYMDAEVSKPLMRVDFSSYNAKIDYQVKEGVRYRVGMIGITQSIEGLKSEDLKDLLSLKEGKVFNIKRMRADMKKLEEEVGNFGFAYVKVAPQMHKDPEQKVINLNYVIQPGELVTIKDVIISGNNITKDRVIRRYLYLAPGDKYNATDLKDSKNSLGRTGFFENVDIQSQRISADKINLLVKVKEASTGTISAGGGYGSYEGLMVNASIADQNFLGTGINTNFGFEISKISTSANIAFTNPKVWDSMYSLSINLYKQDYAYDHQGYDTGYTQDQTGASINVGREFYRNFHVTTGFGYIDNQSTLNEDSNQTVFNSFLYNDQYAKTSIFASVRYDNTDDFYQPREGMKLSVNFEIGQLSGDDVNTTVYPGGYGDYLKTSAKLGLYYGLEDVIDYDLILRFKGRFNHISRNDGEKLPIAEKLFLGGTGSVRGYDPYSLSPYYGVSENRSLVGGTQSAVGSLEASIPLSKAAKMRLAFFYDYGYISNDNDNEAGEPIIQDLTRSSTGVVLEWQSGFGPINLIFAQALDAEIGDRTSVFEFSMGTKF